MDKQKRVLLSWLLVIIVLACAPLYTAPSIPSTPVAGAVDTIVALTVAAAATRTAVLIPPSLTPSFTPFPTQTPSEMPTPTATFRFILPSPTKIRTATPVGGGGAGGYACQLISQDPSNGETFSPKADFDAKWTVKNTGSKTWDSGNVDYIYVSGAKIHQTSIYDLKKNVGVGQQYTVIVDMRAPSDTGTYKTNWALRVGKSNFCSLSLTIVVK